MLSGYRISTYAPHFVTNSKQGICHLCTRLGNDYGRTLAEAEGT